MHLNFRKKKPGTLISKTTLRTEHLGGDFDKHDFVVTMSWLSKTCCQMSIINEGAEIKDIFFNTIFSRTLKSSNMTDFISCIQQKIGKNHALLFNNYLLFHVLLAFRFTIGFLFFLKKAACVTC